MRLKRRPTWESVPWVGRAAVRACTLEQQSDRARLRARPGDGDLRSTLDEGCDGEDRSWEKRERARGETTCCHDGPSTDSTHEPAATRDARHLARGMPRRRIRATSAEGPLREACVGQSVSRRRPFRRRHRQHGTDVYGLDFRATRGERIAQPGPSNFASVFRSTSRVSAVSIRRPPSSVSAQLA